MLKTKEILKDQYMEITHKQIKDIYIYMYKLETYTMYKYIKKEEEGKQINSDNNFKDKLFSILRFRWRRKPAFFFR